MGQPLVWVPSFWEVWGIGYGSLMKYGILLLPLLQEGHKTHYLVAECAVSHNQKIILKFCFNFVFKVQVFFKEVEVFIL